MELGVVARPIRLYNVTSPAPDRATWTQCMDGTLHGSRSSEPLDQINSPSRVGVYQGPYKGGLIIAP